MPTSPTEFGAWNYTQAAWTAYESNTGSIVLETPMPPNEWLLLPLYDVNSGNWLDGLYIFRQQW